jgi:ubiquitin C-terminal hydrolase
VAEQYGKLIKEMWSGNYGAVGPKNFKLTLGKWAPQFSGFQQQDSQELLSFLMDGLHEDLNRVIKKQYPFLFFPP